MSQVFLCFHASYRSRIANILGMLRRQQEVVSFHSSPHSLGLYATLVLFGLRVVIDIPSFVITYARDLPFLIFNIFASVPAIVANLTVLFYFLIRSVTFQPCIICQVEFLQVQDIEEQYVRLLFSKKQFMIAASLSLSLSLHLVPLP